MASTSQTAVPPPPVPVNVEENVERKKPGLDKTVPRRGVDASRKLDVSNDVGVLLYTSDCELLHLFSKLFFSSLFDTFIYFIYISNVTCAAIRYSVFGIWYLMVFRRTFNIRFGLVFFGF